MSVRKLAQAFKAGTRQVHGELLLTGLFNLLSYIIQKNLLICEMGSSILIKSRKYHTDLLRGNLLTVLPAIDSFSCIKVDCVKV